MSNGEREGGLFSRWAYILVGSNETGKTTLQRFLLLYLCDIRYERLTLNVVYPITHPRAPKGLRDLFTANRSYQEKKSKYKSVGRYFKKFFKEADVCILSTHPVKQDVSEMIEELKRRCYNVAGVFWTNNFADDITQLNWDERLRIENPQIEKHRAEDITEQLRRIANQFSQFIVGRAHLQ